MIKLLYSVLLCFAASWIKSQNIYSIDSISSKLKENADAVVRLKRTEFKIKDKSRAILNFHYVITVFNERGVNGHLRYLIYYNKLNKVKNIYGNVFDKNGDKIYKLSKKDIYDASATALGNSVTDDRIKIAEFDNKSFQFPYTIEFVSSVETNNMMFYPSEYFYPSERLSTHEKTLIIETPDDFEFRYKEKKMPNKVNLVTGKNKKIYTWTIKNISASEYEVHTPDDFYPEIITAPKAFCVENYEGNIESWNDIGKFISKLNKDRDVLPESVKQKVAELVSQEKDTLKKIELLYNYLQNNTRYMSIQLGIGGWQTMTAIEVAEKGYGDCKALSNYMKALLREAGIKSYMAIINSGAATESVDSNFPSMKFNHAINCVPLSNDTVWLECTSQTESLGFQGSNTGNRKALLILPDAGVLVNTITYHYFDNTKVTKANVVVDEYGNAKAQVKNKYTGIIKDNKDYLLDEKNEEKLKKMIQNSIHLASFELNTFALQEHKNRIPSLEVSLDLSIQKIGNKTGTFFFLKPNLFNNQIFSIPDKKERNADFYLNPNVFENESLDSLSFQMPKNYIPDNLPEPILIKTPFGEYITSTTFNNGTLFYYRKLLQHGGCFAVKDYSAWLDFCKAINKNDSQQIVFKVKNN